MNTSYTAHCMRCTKIASVVICGQGHKLHCTKERT
uniref:Uncharacterized protein n=1 Tax=Anguilla anguilla TaxID=7936 RepID=A0A0E9XM49_ANGAN